MVSMVGIVFHLTRGDYIDRLKRPIDHGDHVTKVNELIMTRGHHARITYHPTFVESEATSGKRFVARADEKLTAFIELKSGNRGCHEFALTSGRDFFKTPRGLNGS